MTPRRLRAASRPSSTTWSTRAARSWSRPSPGPRGNGDRSENGDYIYGKKRLREIDRRIRFLIKRLDKAEVVDPAAPREPTPPSACSSARR